jgi:hypothetical protein
MSNLKTQPNPNFAAPPYKAQPSGGNNAWWHVENAQGINCLSFEAGQKFTSEATAKELANNWNSKAAA